jgi:hypothetical protein
MSEDNKIALNLDEANQLLFKMNVKGTNKSPSTVRLVFEGKDFVYGISGTPAEDEDFYKFDVPALHNKLDEGSYSTKVEVVVDGRYFVPVEFSTEFKRPMQVQAESLIVTKGHAMTEQSAKKPIVAQHTASSPKEELSVQAEMLPTTRQKYNSLKEKYVKKETPTKTESSNVSLNDALRKIVQEAVTEAQPVRPRSK